MDFLVVGAGAMGRWFGHVLREDAPEPVSLAFVDTSREAADRAARALDGRAVPATTDEQFDGVCIAVPIPAASEAIAEFADRADGAIHDVTGTMAGPVETMRESAPDCERVSFHPLFAPGNEPGNVPLVADKQGPITAVVWTALTNRGNDLFETTPREHDEAMETVQARTHAAVLAYGLAAENVDERFHTPVSAGIQSLAEQVTGGDPNVYSDIQAAFDGAEDVADAASRLAEADARTFESLYADAGE